MNKKFIHRLAPLLAVVLGLAALQVLHHELKAYHYHEVAAALRALPHRNILIALLLTALSYTVLTMYDAMALRYLNRPLGYARTALASFLGYVFSHNVGLSFLGAGAARYHIYSILGLSAVEVAGIVAFCGFTFWVGVCAVAGTVFLLQPPDLPASLHLPISETRPLGAIFLALVIAYLLLAALRTRPIAVGRWQFRMPSLRLAIEQVLVSSLDWTIAAAVFYILLPARADFTFFNALGIFTLAQVIGMVSHVPGGLGVFESVIVIILSPETPAAAVLGSLIVYRVVYYLLPFAVGITILATFEFVRRRTHVARVGRFVGRWAATLVPHAFAVMIFVAGLILMFSAATPAIHERLDRLSGVVPLPIMEMSHFLGSLLGTALLLLSRGLRRRLDAAYHLTMLALLGGIVFSLIKGLDYEEATVLFLMLLALLPCRRYFHRKASLLSQRFTVDWIVLIVLAIAATTWLGFFSHKHVEYAHDLWWQFSFTGHAPRFLRALAGGITLLLLFSVAKLLGPARPHIQPPGPAELEKAESIVAGSTSTYASLALLGDKAFLFNPRGNAFIMYAVEGRSWVSMGDPVGPESEMLNLIWQFREFCDRHDGWSILYEVSQRHLHLYLEAGLTLFKIGEEARVHLPDFEVESSTHKPLRQILHRMERENCSFDILPREAAAARFPELQQISDAWLSSKSTREKGFSLGFFHEDYIKRFPIAVATSNERIVAFANVWAGADRQELSLDLMRYTPDAPKGVMEFLFTRLMLWGRQEGYQWFNLGVSPLSGLRNRRLVPTWSRLGALVFQHGEHFYNFQGLRYYKDKFNPQWQPKYLACPARATIPRVLLNIASLTSGGLRGTVLKRSASKAAAGNNPL